MYNKYHDEWKWGFMNTSKEKLRSRILLHAVFVGIIAFLIIFVIFTTACKDNKNINDETTYQNKQLNMDMSMSADVDAFNKKLNCTYAKNLATDLATNPDIADFKLWRTAGSDGEHKAADYLVNEMKKIGLQNVEKKGTPCDKFQFNNANLKIANTDIDIVPGPFQTSGTKGVLTTEIVDCKDGFAQDFEKVNVSGKIALIKVDFYNIAWIDAHLREAKLAGAAALVCWMEDGYAEKNPDSVNVQDICGEDIMPICSISANDAKRIIESIASGNNLCSLNIDTNYENDNGTTYNVMGMIPGKSHENHIILSSHYDKYWEGFQDNSCAVALLFCIAKAMIESDYQPEHDIYFICHGSEEWGVIDSQFDWATGSWGLLHSSQAFCDSTLADFNCEMPAFKRDENLNIACDFEFHSLVNDIFNSGLVLTSGDIKFGKSIQKLSTYEDGISYKWHGVPHIYDYVKGQSFMFQNYHTIQDNESTFDNDTFLSNVYFYGAGVIYVDKTPALKLDFSKTANVLTDQFVESTAKAAGVDVALYKETLDGLISVANNFNAKVDLCNANYEKAYKENNAEDMKLARKQAKTLNEKAHEAFKIAQNGFAKVGDGVLYYGHSYGDESYEIIDQSLTYLNKGDILGNGEDTGAGPSLYALNFEHEYNYCIFDRATTTKYLHLYESESYANENISQWATNRTDAVIDIEDAAVELLNASSINDIKDINHVIQVLENGKVQSLNLIAKNCNSEIEAITKIINCLKISDI